MPQINWIGGSPCAGKTTISHIIGQEFGWQIYHIDRNFERYLQRANAVQHPHLIQYKNMGLQQFLLQDPYWQLEQVKGISKEQFEFILEDIAELPVDKPILVEGANLRVADVIQQIQTPSQAIWLVPTEAFQLETYPKRGSWVQDVLRHHYEPDDAIVAFERWMQRDALMAEWTANEAESQEIPVIRVDGSVSLLDNAEIVMRHFGLLES